MTKELTYTTALKELETIVDEMENDQVEVDDLLKKVERASELLKFCREKLTKTEQDVRDALKDLSPDQNPPVKEE